MRTSDMKRLGEAWASVTSNKLEEGYTEEEIRELCHSKDHDCAVTVNHPEWGLGKPIYESHAIPTDEGYVEWYDVQFKHGIEKRVPAADMEVIEEASHGAVKSNKKKDDEKVLKSAKEDASNDKEDDGEGMDKVDPKAAKKKFKDRKDKDIDNDGDVDSTDKYLHKRRKAIGKAMAKDDDNGEEEKGNGDEEAPTPVVTPKPKKKKAEISKIGEAAEELLDMLESAAKAQKSNATEPEDIMDKESEKSKQFAMAHAKSDKKIEDNYEDGVKKTTEAGRATKAKSGKRAQDNAAGDTNVVKSTEAPVKGVKESVEEELVEYGGNPHAGSKTKPVSNTSKKPRDPDKFYIVYGDYKRYSSPPTVKRYATFRGKRLPDGMKLQNLMDRYPGAEGVMTLANVERKGIKMKESKEVKEMFRDYTVVHTKTGRTMKIRALSSNDAKKQAAQRSGGGASRYSGTSANDFHIENNNMDAYVNQIRKDNEKGSK